ncbi:hypothetical protein A9Z60_07060 [Moraxella nonliquefaciens]|uniref:Uncharacterized protein n=1 Tax=Moraxella nonliquefaciens TaxID=478 RepID=A0A1B8PKJ7_MORNO|nr:hypothetical protein A9Z60_07060 [Moraxella nonliquefaciens]
MIGRWLVWSSTCFGWVVGANCNLPYDGALTLPRWFCPFNFSQYQTLSATLPELYAIFAQAFLISPNFC